MYTNTHYGSLWWSSSPHVLLPQLIPRPGSRAHSFLPAFPALDMQVEAVYIAVTRQGLRGTPNSWMVKGKSQSKMDDLGLPPFMETTIF